MDIQCTLKKEMFFYALSTLQTIWAKQEQTTEVLITFDDQIHSGLVCLYLL